MLHESYKPGRQVDVLYDDGPALRIASVVEGGVKCMVFVFCTQLRDGSYAAFDIRQIRQLQGVFDGVNGLTKGRLGALGAAVHTQFATADLFHAAIIGISLKLAACPAVNLH